MIYLVSFLSGFGGSAVSIICGFGLGIFTMMFLPHVMTSPLAAASVVSIISVFQSAWVCYHYRKKVQWKDIIFTSIGYFLISTIAVVYGKNIPSDMLKLGLGVLMILLAIYFIFFSARIRVKPTPINGVFAGGLGGVMSALFGVGGPPASIYFSSAYEDKEMYLSTIQTYFLFSNIYVTAVRSMNGIITKAVILASIASIAGMAAGTCLGKIVFDKINAEMVRKGIYLLMAVSGITLIQGVIK